MLSRINDVLGVLTPVLLLAAGIFFLFRLRFFYLRHPLIAFRTAMSRDSADGVSPVRALSLALAGTLGVGNIVGVASSIALGGYGSVFWMWVSALVAMILKYAEIVLAMLYRKRDGDGAYHGGAFYYIREFFRSHGLARAGVVMGGVFAVLCILNSATMGAIIQANAVSTALSGGFDMPLWVTGVLLCAICLPVIIRGSERISRFTEKLVLVMSIMYVAVSVAILVMYRERVPTAFGRIFSDAFGVRSIGSGFMGFIFTRSFRMGSMRGLMSNEAGCGTAPTAHAVSSTENPVKQGLLGIAEVFVDTIILCTLTALIIIIAGEGVLVYSEPMMITLHAYTSLLGDKAALFVCAAVVMFAIATIVCWAHYGKEAVRYFSTSASASGIFVAAYILLVFFGAVCASTLAWELADLAIGLMTVINVTVLCFMSGRVQKETWRWMRLQPRRRRSKHINM